MSGPGRPAFGPDGNGDGIKDLYIASADTDEILRYDGVTGAFWMYSFLRAAADSMVPQISNSVPTESFTYQDSKAIMCFDTMA